VYQGPYLQHFIFFVTYELAQQARVFVTSKPFQPSLIFKGKAGAYPGVEHLNALAYYEKL
jgi:hypothetical protein